MKISTLIHYLIYIILLYFAADGSVLSKNIINVLVTLNFVVVSAATSLVTFLYFLNDRNIMDRFYISIKATDVKKNLNSEYRYLNWMFSASFAAFMFAMGWYIIGTISAITFISSIISGETLKYIIEDYEKNQRV